MKVESIDEMLGAPARMAILATLADGKAWVFSALKEETGLADGNLHVQTGKLKAAGLVWVEKVPQGGRQVTSFTITEKGRGLLEEHVRHLRAALDKGDPDRGSQEPGQESPGAKGGAGRPDRSRVW